MSLPTPRRGKSLESVKRQVKTGLRNSARKSFPQATEVPVKTPQRGVTVETPEESFTTPQREVTVGTPEESFKTPKRVRRKSTKLDKCSKEKRFKAINSGRFRIPNVLDKCSTEKRYKAINSGRFRIPNVLDTKKDEKVCAFYRKTMGPNGNVKFSPSLIKYFMKTDSPEYEHLRLKRFNPSFRRERPRNRESLQIFTEEELNDETRFPQNVPNIVSNLPDIPGTEYRDAFACMPDIEFDFDFKKGKGKRKSVRCAAYSGKPLPDEHLLPNYPPSFWEESNSGHEEKEEKNISISSSHLSSPSEGPITQDDDDNLLLANVEERNYKGILTKEVSVVLTKLPIEPYKLPCKVKNNEEKKKKINYAKKNVDKEVNVSRFGVPKLEKRKNGNIESNV